MFLEAAGRTLFGGQGDQLRFQVCARLVVVVVGQGGQGGVDDPEVSGGQGAGGGGAHAGGVGDGGVVESAARFPGGQAQAAGEHLSLVDEPDLPGGTRGAGGGQDTGLRGPDAALGLFEGDQFGMQLRR